MLCDDAIVHYHPQLYLITQLKRNCIIHNFYIFLIQGLTLVSLSTKLAIGTMKTIPLRLLVRIVNKYPYNSGIFAHI